MKNLFISFKEISLVCNAEVVAELDRYLNMLEDEQQRVIVENKLKDKLSNIYHGSYLSRGIIMKALIWVIGMKPEQYYVCDEKICECAIKFYKWNGYKRLAKYDQYFLANLNSYSAPMIKSITRFRFSKDYSRYRSRCSALLHSETFTDIFGELQVLYGDKNSYLLYKSMMYYRNSLVQYANDTEPRIIQVCKLLSNNNIDYLDLTYRILMVNHKEVDINELLVYSKRIDSLNIRYGVDWMYFFKDIPDIRELENLIFILANDVNFSELSGGKDPLFCLEEKIWHANGLSIEEYIKKGYRSTEQLRFIRFLLKSDIDPDDLGINPSMSVETMRKIVEISSLEKKKPKRKKRYVNRANEWYSARPGKR